jgi:cytosine/uracil/thiamine/allantoin permease
MIPAGRAAVAFIPWQIIEEPASAAHFVHNFGAFLSPVAPGIAEFFTSL